MRGSCSVTIAIPVHRQLVHITLAVPLQHPQKVLLPLVGSMTRPGVFEVLHSAHVRYPVPLQYMHSLRSCSSTYRPFDHMEYEEPLCAYGVYEPSSERSGKMMGAEWPQARATRP